MRSSRALVVAMLGVVMALGAGCASKTESPGAESTGGARPGASVSSSASAPTSDVTSSGEAADSSKSRDDATKGEGTSPGAKAPEGAKPDGGAPKAEANLEADLGSNVLVYVSNTARTKPPSKTEIRLGDSVFEPNVTVMMDRGVVGPLAAGKSGTLVIYPDGRDGKKISIKIRVPAGASGPRSRIVDVAISDDGVRVLGEMVLPESSAMHARF